MYNIKENSAYGPYDTTHLANSAFTYMMYNVFKPHINKDTYDFKSFFKPTKKEHIFNYYISIYIFKNL